MPARKVLMPLIVMALAAALYFWPSHSHDDAPVAELSGDVARCGANLRQIYAGIVRCNALRKEVPSESGVRFLGALIAGGWLEDTPENRACLTCPGPNAAPVPKAVDYHALETLTGADSAYAARDSVAYPLPRFPLGGSEIEPLVACDNEHGLNHAGCMNVLYSDGSVKTLFLAQEIERGHLPPGATTIPVGKDSPIPNLRKLSQE